MQSIQSIEGQENLNLEGLSGCAFATHKLILHEFFKTVDVRGMLYNEDVALTNFLRDKGLAIFSAINCLALHDYEPGILSLSKIYHWLRSRATTQSPSSQMMPNKSKASLKYLHSKAISSTILAMRLCKYLYTTLAYKVVTCLVTRLP
jgi:hypothetical protein